MESNNLSNSVQDEQFDKKTIVETIETPSSDTSAANLGQTQENEIQQPIINDHVDESEEFEVKDEHVILPEELLVPEELLEDDDELSDEGHLEHSSVDYSTFSKEDLVVLAEKIFKEKPIESLKLDFDNIKIQFYKKHKADTERLRKLFVENGGTLEEFQQDPDVLEERLKEVLKQYRDRKAEYNKKAEVEKTENLKVKQAIIEEIKVLINGNESLNETFHQFRELQKKWRSVGLVPQAEVNNLWENYNHHVEKFYDFIKINKELRDLDLKKNFDIKIELCEKAEELLMEPSVVKAFKQLQDFHNKWRETGPVPNEMRNDIWNRFKDITSKINKRHQEYFDTLKTSQQNNFDAKTLLCEKAEDIIKADLSTIKAFEDKSKELIELQNVWKTIGFAPRKDNTRIYQRFRAACDAFFSLKREFFGKIKEEQNNNLQLKLDLCIQAEALKDSTEWKRSTEDLINIQKKWKEIGPVPRKISDQIWKRFRAACDTFFNNKSAYYANVDSKFEDNLKQKLALIEEIEAYQLLESVDENFTNLKDYQRRWAEIGFVPIKQKEDIQARYHKAIDKLFDSLKVDDGKRKMMRFKNRMEQMPQGRKSEVKMDRERDKLIMRLKKLENDIVLWDNNIGFFAKSKNADAMIADVQSKINQARTEIKEIEDKIRVIDSMEQ